MDTLSLHVEYLLREHDCVVLPGFGAFICDNRQAAFGADGTTLLPPGRRLAFNPLINRNDGLLATSVARREAIPFEAASRQVAERIAHLRGELQREERMIFGRLGRFMLNADGVPAFAPSELPGINGAYFGLKSIAVTPLGETKEPENTAASANAPLHGRRRRSWRAVRAYASGIAAAVAVAVTIGMFLLNPVRISKPTTEASLAPGIERTEPRKTEIPASASVVAPAKTAPAEAEEPVKIAEPTETVAHQAKTVEPSTTATTTAATPKTAEPATARFNAGDSYYVIVASFATQAQADTYLAENPGKQLGVIEKDSRYRVYAATGSSYDQANAQKKFIGNADAWVCRR